MKYGKIILGLWLVTLVSCSGRKVFEERHVFEKLKWNAFESVFFETDIDDIDQDYDISVEVRHHTVYPYDQLSMTLAVYAPSGERRVKEFTLLMKNPDGTFRASGMGDLWDLTEPVMKQFRFNEKGHYKFEIENTMPKFDTPGIMEIGLKIEKSEVE